MATLRPIELIESINAETLRVHAPTPVVFLFGGPTNGAAAAPLSQRDAFSRIFSAGGLTGCRLVLAEAANPTSMKVGYHELLSFETDISGVVSLILLFCESAGSLAELGSFSAIPPIAERLLVVIDDFFYGQSSFVRNGPIAHIENKYGDERVLVVDRADVGIDAEGSAAKIDLAKLASTIVPTVQDRLAAAPATEKYSPGQPGHLALLMTGIVQMYGALTISEIKEYLDKLNCPASQSDITRGMYCSEVMGWSVRKKKGNHSYYISLTEVSAIDFQFKQDVINRDKLRWRADLRLHWKKTDSARFRGIAEVAAANAASR